MGKHARANFKQDPRTPTPFTTPELAIRGRHFFGKKILRRSTSYLRRSTSYLWKAHPYNGFIDSSRVPGWLARAGGSCLRPACRTTLGEDLYGLLYEMFRVFQ